MMSRFLAKAFLIITTITGCSSPVRSPDILTVIPKDETDLPAIFEENPPCDQTPFASYIQEEKLQQLNPQQRYQIYLSTLLVDAIKKIEGIQEAKVELTGADANQELQAKITIKHTGALDNPHSSVYMQIKRLAVAIIPNLKLENVVIIPQN